MGAFEVVAQGAGGGADIDHGVGQQGPHGLHSRRDLAADPAVAFGQVLLSHRVGERVDETEQLVVDGFHLLGEPCRLDQPFTGAQERPRQVRVPDPNRPQYPVQRDGAGHEVPDSVQRLVGDRGVPRRRLGQPQQRMQRDGLAAAAQHLDRSAAAVERGHLPHDARSRGPALLDGPTHRIQPDPGHRARHSGRRTGRQLQAARTRRGQPGEPFPSGVHSWSPSRRRAGSGFGVGLDLADRGSAHAVNSML
ncbi:hypothetical protein KGQ19_13785 [Catenulispora sp. NL8]|uniref:Uncharacterized protein n=1 Tax=Catenulispora pinistramenti TaxID=2705254 RepID=A0ABS5KPG3_9ACTN|nr:hypothetical protein [Catenulispora pinistramenti]